MASNNFWKLGLYMLLIGAVCIVLIECENLGDNTFQDEYIESSQEGNYLRRGARSKNSRSRSRPTPSSHRTHTSGSKHKPTSSSRYRHTAPQLPSTSRKTTTRRPPTQPTKGTTTHKSPTNILAKQQGSIQKPPTKSVTHWPTQPTKKTTTPKSRTNIPAKQQGSTQKPPTSFVTHWPTQSTKSTTTHKSRTNIPAKQGSSQKPMSTKKPITNIPKTKLVPHINNTLTNPTNRWQTTKATTWSWDRQRPITTSTVSPIMYPRQPSKMKWIIPDSKRNLLFGGLAGTALGMYLGYQINKINWNVDVPAYSVQHYWHQGVNPVSGDKVIENKVIKDCSSNVFFCLPDTIPMCFSNGEVYCVVPQYKTQPCTNSSAGTCFQSIVRLPCGKSRAPECIYYNSTWRYERATIPCLRNLKVNYTQASTKYDKRFFIRDKFNKTGGNDTCKCNTTETPKKLMVTCVSVNLDSQRRILCSGMNLVNNTAVSINMTLNSTNAKSISCLPTEPTKNETLSDIFEAQKMSLLSRCETVNNTNTSFSIEMFCGHIGNLSNVSIPIDPNVITFNCEVNSTETRANLTATAQNVTNSNNTVKQGVCSCNSTVNNVNTTLVNSTVSNRNIKSFVSTNFCVYVSAIPMKLYTNSEYAEELKKNPDERKEAASVYEKIMSVIARYILS